MTCELQRLLAAFLRRSAWLLAAAALLVGSVSIRADVVGLGDITPFKTEDGEQIPDLPQFGGPVTGGLLVVGGTDDFIGGTATGQMTIDIPSDTDPLVAERGIIGGISTGLGLVRVVSLNSEWRLNQSLSLGHQGQGFLEIIAGARVATDLTDSTGPANPGDDDYDLVMGAFEEAQGFALLDGFASLLVTTNASIGHRGTGRIDMLNRARFVTRSEAAIGTIVDLDDNAVGNGYVLLDGQGTRWTVGLTATTAQDPDFPPQPDDNLDGLLTVGKEGRGTLEIRNQAVVRVETDTLLGDQANSHGEAIVSGLNSQLWTLRNLFVGNGDVAAGLLTIDDRATVRADGGSSISPSGGTTVGALGVVDLTGGALLTPHVINGGVLRGDGRVESIDFVNNGEIRNAAGVANQRERMVITGELTNNADIESIGGEMEFQGPVTNVGPDGDIVAVDAILRFNDTFTNSGNLHLDNSVVWVPGTFTSAANLSLAPSSLDPDPSVIIGNINLTSSNTLHVELGAPYSRLEVTGSATLGGNVAVSLANDYLPQLGDAFEIIEAGSLAPGFASVIGGGAGAGFWEASYTATGAILSYVEDIVSPFTADFDGNGKVDGGDLAIWRANVGLGAMPPPAATPADGDANGDGVVDGADFFVWQQQNGSMVPSTPASTAVPEPAAWALALAALALPAWRRRK